MISDEEAANLTLTALNQSGSGMTYRVVGLTRGRRDCAVTVERTMPSGEVDFPASIFVVDGETGSVRGLRQAINEGWKPDD